MNRCRVLVVDDDPALRRLMLIAVRRARHMSVEGASNGAEAIEKLRESRWDVLVLDLMMPKLSGWDVLEWLSHHRDHLPRSIIVATAADRKVVRELDPQLVNAILFKPFDVFQLVAYVKAAAMLPTPDRRRRRVISELPSGGAG